MSDATLGPLGRIARWCAEHSRLVLLAWVVAVLVLGALLPKVEHALSGAGMQRSGSESLKVREAAEVANPLAASSAIQVVMHGKRPFMKDPGFQRATGRVIRTLQADKSVAGVTFPMQSGPISRDGRTVIVTGGAGGSPKEMIRAVDRLRDRVRDAGGDRYPAYTAGLSAQWADFNKEHREATLRSERFAFPITLVVLVLAFGSLAAAGMPLLITAISLAVTGGVIFLGTQVIDISLWAMTFVLIFSMALGIDYALFIVMRFRDALREHRDPVSAVAATMDTAGRAVAFSGTTVLVALLPTFLIPSPMPRSIALGVMLSVVLVMAVTFTLMPTLLGKLGPRIDAGALPWRKRANAAPASETGVMYRWGAFLWRKPWPLAAAAVLMLFIVAIPVTHLKIGIPGEKVQAPDAPSRVGSGLALKAFGAPALAPVTVLAEPGTAKQVRRIMRRDRGLLGVQRLPVAPGSQAVLFTASMRSGIDADAGGRQIDALRAVLPRGALVGGAPAELYDVRVAMQDAAPIVIGMILLLGFLLLLVAVKAPVIALAGTLTSVLSTAAAFGVTVWIFQDGNLSGLLDFESQGFLDFWAPVFFFAMIFAIAMDYTIFFVSAARDEFDRSRDNRSAIVSGMGRSGPVIVAAAAAMIAVYATFAACPAVAAKEMGVMLGISVLLDAFLIRLTLLPAIMRLAGDWTWWEPRALTRILPKFSLSHAAPAAAAPVAVAPPVAAPVATIREAPAKTINTTWVLIVLCSGVGLVIAALTALYAAGPELAREIGASQTELTWITDAYTLTMAGLLLPAGALGDRYGRRGLMIAGLVVFVLASVVIQFVESAGGLIAGRAVLGVGAAMILPSTLSLITSTFPADTRDRAVAIWTAAFSMAGVVGGLSAAILLEYFSWKSAFWSVLAGGVVVLAMALTLPTSRDDDPPSVDVNGSLAVMLSISALVYGLIQAGLDGWTDPVVLAALALGLLAAAVFAVLQLRSANPLLDVRLFKIRPFGVSAFTVTICFAAVYGLFFLVMQYQQFVLGKTALQATVPMAAMGFTVIPITLAAGWLTRHLGLRMIVSGGCFLCAGGFAILATADTTGSALTIYGTTLIIGAGLGLNMAPCTAAIINNVTEAKQGVAASVNHTTREVGTALGVALFGGLISGTYAADMLKPTDALPGPARDASRESIAGALEIASQAGPSGRALSDAAQQAFVNATQHTSLVMIGVMTVAGVIAAVWAPPRHRDDTPIQIGELEPERERLLVGTR